MELYFRFRRVVSLVCAICNTNTCQFAASSPRGLALQRTSAVNVSERTRSCALYEKRGVWGRQKTIPSSVALHQKQNEI